MSAKFKPILGNLALAGGSLFATLLVVELVVFGFILKPDDLLENVTVDGVVRYMPETHANFRHPDGRVSRVTINRNGWNSTKSAYQYEKQPGRLRIAVVGDSYVHGAFVDVEDGFPHLLEANLRAEGFNVEVYRFGMDGAPLSQHLNVLRKEVLAYRPDVVVVPLVHNDFDESYRFLKTRYASSFMKLDVDGAGTVVEIAPAEYKPGLADRLRRFATFRYLYYETGLYLKVKAWVSVLFWGGNEKYSPEFIQSAVDIRKIKDHDKNLLFSRYVLRTMKDLSLEHGFKLAVVMDGVREAVYAGKARSDYEVGRLNEISAQVSGELGLAFLDLQDAFAADFTAHGLRFEYPYDWHWNKRGNEIAAREIGALLKSTTGLFGPVSRKTAGAGAVVPR